MIYVRYGHSSVKFGIGWGGGSCGLVHATLRSQYWRQQLFWKVSKYPNSINKILTSLCTVGNASNKTLYFHRPQLDLLIWILVTMLIPIYYRKLDQLLNYNSCFCELPGWQKEFKWAWKKLTKTPISGLEMNPKYKPATKKWICAFPYFVTSHVLLCKYLVHTVPPVPHIFFLKVKKNHTTSFWLHPTL